MYFVYMIKNADDTLYVGISVDPEKRLQTHNLKRGARFTKTSCNFKLAFSESYPTMAEARRREIKIKKWRRDKKEMLIERYLKELPTKQF